MPNHFHLVIETPGPDLAVGMHRLKNSYVQWFNRRHDLDGHLFQGRYHGVHVDNTVHLLELGRYLALNPVRSGLCRAPEDWPWSSYRAMIDLAPPGFLAVDETLSHFGADRERARARFRAFVLDGDTRVRAE